MAIGLVTRSSASAPAGPGCRWYRKFGSPSIGTGDQPQTRSYQATVSSKRSACSANQLGAPVSPIRPKPRWVPGCQSPTAAPPPVSATMAKWPSSPTGCGGRKTGEPAASAAATVAAMSSVRR